MRFGSTGFYRNKAKAVRDLSAALLERHHGHVPRTMEELTALPGVGRKTASILLGACFGVPALPVDTHVGRVSFRLGLTGSKDPTRIEEDLAEAIPREKWWEFATRLRVARAAGMRRPQTPVPGVRPGCRLPEAGGGTAGASRPGGGSPQRALIALELAGGRA